MQLAPRRLAARWSLVALGALIAAVTGEARADGELSLRGVYYKEKATRVAQPMIDAVLEVGEDGELTAHTLADAITSASAAAGAVGEPFSETRLEFGAGYMHRLGRFRAGGGVRYSNEPDYQSLFAMGRGQVELADRNTAITVAAARGRDDVSNASSQGGISEPVRGTLDTTLASVSLTQVLSPVMIAGLTYDFIFLEGFQENPYRTVAAGGMLVPERVPDRRFRHAVLGSVRRFVPGTGSTLIAGYRFYADDWGIIGHTPEARLVQEVTSGLDVHLRYRYYRQNAADFYQDIYDSADPEIEPFLTDDAKLSAMSTQTFGVKLDAALAVLGLEGRTGKFRVQAMFEYMLQSTHYGNAINLQLGLVVPLEY